ncbi:MAG: hypothetical protein ABIJ09_14365 [Pseudomonadota bacterium]
MASKLLDLTPHTTCSRVTSHRLQQHLVGEGTPEQRRDIDQHLETCLDCASLVAGLRSDAAAFSAVMPFERFAADFERRAQARRSWVEKLRAWRWPALGSVAVAAAAAVVLLVVTPVDDSGLRSKGSDLAGIGYLVREPAGARRGDDGEQLKAGQQIQFLLRPARSARSVVLLGVDGRGAVTVYHAEALTQQTKGVETLSPLPGSVILDDAVGPERFFAVFSDDGDVEMLHQLAQSAALKLVQEGVDLSRVERLPVDDPGVHQTSISIVKVAP